MPSIITDIGRTFIADALAAGPPEAVDITTVKFASVTFGDPPNPPLPSAALTALEGTLRHTAAVSGVGKVDDDAVIYTCFLDTTVGDFEINQVGYFADDGLGGLVLIMVSNIPPVHKRKNDAGQTGNNYKHSEILSILDAAAATAVTVPPETWQMDFTALLALKQSLAEKGLASGYASLDASTKVPDAQLPATQAAKTIGGVLLSGNAANARNGLTSAATPATNYPPGISYEQVSTVDGWPYNGIAVTVLTNDTRVMQYLVQATGGSTTALLLWRTYHPSVGGGGWTAWQEVQQKSQKAVANGYASLDGSGDVPDAQIPPGVARLASPALTGTPTAPTAAPGTNTTQLSTTAFVQAAIAALVAAAPGVLDTLDELAAALGDDANFATTIANALALKAPLASPALTGTPTAPTAVAATDTTQLATTAFVKQLIGAANYIAGLDAGGKVAQDIDGGKITSGTVADARIASTIARDSEVASAQAAAESYADAAVTAHAAAADPHAGYLLESEAAAAVAADNGAGAVSTTSYATIKSTTVGAGKIAANGWAVRVTARLTSDKTTGTFGLRILLNGVNVGEITGNFGALQTEVCIDTTIVYTGATTGLCLIQVSHVDGVTVAKAYMQSFGVTGLAWGSVQTVAAQALRDPTGGTTSLLGFWVYTLRHTIT